MPSPRRTKRKSPARRTRRKRNNLILDLDETLISAVEHDEIKGDIKKRIKNFETIEIEGYGAVALRPHVKEFLDFAFKHFNVSVWSAGTRPYVNDVISKLFKRRQLDLKMNFTHCSFSEVLFNDEQKDLDFIYRVIAPKTHSKKNTIFVDNLASNTSDSNAIRIPDFDVRRRVSTKDSHLLTLMKCLSRYTSKDVSRVSCNF